MHNVIKRLCALALAVSTLSAFPAASISDIVEQMKNAKRENIVLPEGSTITDLARYCRDWALESKIDYNGIILRTDTPSIEVYVKNVQWLSLYDVLEMGCASSYHFFTIKKDGLVYIYPNIPEYIEAREWTNTKGKKLKAKWVGCADGDADAPIFMTVPNGKLMKIDIEKMCAKDRRYLRESRLRSQKISYTHKNGRWMSRLDEYIEKWKAKEKRYIEIAKNIILEKSYKKGARYRVFQILDIGTLCIMARVDSRGNIVDYGGELFLDWGLQRGMVASDESYSTKKPLYWLGTYTYVTKRGDDRTVNVYDVCSLDYAINMVRSLQGLYEPGDSRFDREHPGNDGDNSSLPRNKSDELQIAGFGSGFFITSDGYFITNYHVIQDAAKVSLKMGDEFLAAKIVKTDKETDLALLKVEGTFNALEFSPRRQENLGQSIFTMGYPQPQLQGVTPKVTKGVISGLEGFKGDIRNYQIDASIQPGNSGGPVADSNGYVVGVVVASLIKGSNGGIPQNVNYVIKKSYLMAFLDSIPSCATALRCPASETERDFVSAVKIIEKSCALVVVYE